MSAQLAGASVSLSIQFESFIKEGYGDPYKDNNDRTRQNTREISEKESQAQEQSANSDHEPCLDRPQLSPVCESSADGVTDANGSRRGSAGASAASG